MSTEEIQDIRKIMFNLLNNIIDEEINPKPKTTAVNTKNGAVKKAVEKKVPNVGHLRKYLG
jgi:hypothetical protein